MIPISDDGIDTTAANLGQWKLKIMIWYNNYLASYGDCILSDWEVFEE